MNNNIAKKLLAAGIVISTVIACKNSTTHTSTKPVKKQTNTNDGKKTGAQTTTPTPTPSPSYFPQVTPTPTPIVSPTPTPTPQNTECYKATAFICKVERLITDMTNQYRVQNGRVAVAHDPKISFVSRDWSATQARSGSIGHSGFPNSRQSVYQREFGVSIYFAAENVAMTGYVNSNSEDDQTANRIAKEFTTMWWNSSGHRVNMLGQSHRQLGVGVAKSSYGWYATQIFK